jgi:hypothetical protein
VKSGRDSLLIAIPLIALLFVFMFRLDEVFASSKKDRKRQPPARGVDEEGREIFSGPDGKPIRQFGFCRLPDRYSCDVA